MEKDTGKVKRIVNGEILEKPLLDANVSGLGESGLVGVAAANKNSYYGQINNNTYWLMEGSQEIK